MKKTIHPASLLLPLIILAVVCFIVYFSAHPITWTHRDLPVEPQKNTTESSQLVRVEKVIDGDTIAAVVGGQKMTIRLIGVNAPETYQGKSPECFAEASFQYVKNRIEGKQISLVGDSTQENKDKYERLLRYVVLEDGTNLNLELVQKGYAKEYTYKIPYQFQQEFRNAQTDAKTRNVGLWSECQ